MATNQTAETSLPQNKPAEKHKSERTPGVTGVLLDIIRLGPGALGPIRTAVLLFIAERTLAYKKLSDTPSINQMVNGIRSKAGNVVTTGCGFGRRQVCEATASLVFLGLLHKVKRSDPKKGNLPTEYSGKWDAVRAYLNENSGIKKTPLVRQGYKGVPEPLQTGPSEDPLCARDTSPCAPGIQEQYLDLYSPTPPSEILEVEKAGKRTTDYASAKPADDASGRDVPRAATPKTEDSKADQPAKAAGKEKKTPSVEQKTEKAESMPKDAKKWPASDLARVRARVTAFFGYDPSEGFEESIMLRMGGRPAADFLELLDRKWKKRECRPGGKWAPNKENWFLPIIDGEYSPDRLPEQPAQQQPDISELNAGIAAVELPDAPDSLVSSQWCKCGVEIREYADRVEGECICSRTNGRSYDRSYERKEMGHVGQFARASLGRVATVGGAR
jgi:hypothetical protein